MMKLLIPLLLLGAFSPEAAGALNLLPLACDSRMESSDGKSSLWRIYLHDLDTGKVLWERLHVPLDLSYDGVWNECMSIRKVVRILARYHRDAVTLHPTLDCRMTTKTLAEKMSPPSLQLDDHRVLLVAVVPGGEIPFWWTTQIPAGSVPAGLQQCRDRIAAATAAGLE